VFDLHIRLRRNCNHIGRCIHLFVKMDFLLKEIDEIKSDLRRLEEKISRLEDDSNFKPEDVRYKRLVDEKHLLLSHLCQLRTSIYSHGVVAAPVESSSSNAGNSEETLGTKRQRTTGN
jgi:hypothetical protein